MMNLIKEDIDGDLSVEAMKVLHYCLEYSVSFLENHCLTSTPLAEFVIYIYDKNKVSLLLFLPSDTSKQSLFIDLEPVS